VGAKAKDLTGYIFNRLVVIERIENQKKHPVFRCKCICGNIINVRNDCLTNNRVKSCGCLRTEMVRAKKPHRRGENNPLWKGGTKDSHGYHMIYRPEHPNAQKRGYLYEHIIIMSNILERPLLPGETVHHKNGIKDDNRPKNLELWVNHHPNGQRLEDLIPYWVEMLNRYAPQRLENSKEINNIGS